MPIKKLLQSITKSAAEARDARIGAVGAQQVRDLYETDPELAKDLNQKYLKANTTGILSAPMAGEFTTYGLIGGGARLLSGTAGSTIGSLGLGALGDVTDKKLNTNFLGDTGRLLGGLAGFGAGMKATTPLLRSAATKGVTLHMPDKTFTKLRREGFRNQYNHLSDDSLLNTDGLRKRILSFAPKQFKSATTYDFNYGMPKKTIPLTESEKLGIPKHERPMYDPEVLQKAKLFAEEYGYPEPKTPEEIKNMYRRHNTAFRTVGDIVNDQKKYSPRMYNLLPESLKQASTIEEIKILASKGYPKSFRYWDLPEYNELPNFPDGFVFVSPTLEENSSYFVNGALNNTVKLQRPFSLRNPKTWHKDADWRVYPANSWKDGQWPKGRVEVGNATPNIEFKISTKHLIPVDIAKPTDLGTKLPEYLIKRVDEAADSFLPPSWLSENNGAFTADYLGITPRKFSYKQGGILKAQKDSFENWYKTVPKSYNDTTNYNLRRAYELAPLSELEAWKNDPQKNHLRSVYLNNSGEYEFVKSPNHPTINKELEWFNSKDAEEFRKKYYLDSTSSPWKYKLK